MQIHQLVKTALTDHKQKIELTQWAIISGISSLFYSEYISKIKHKEVPVRSISVPAIKNVSNYLRADSKFMKDLSDKLIDEIANHYLIKKYSNAPELVMFNENNIEIMKTIYDLYIAPNITRRIPETIAKKFGLNDQDNPSQLFKENWEIELFNNKPINEDQFEFIVDQTVLQLLMLIPTMKKEVEIPEERLNIWVSNDKILTIANENAICPIHFTPAIVNNDSVIDLLTFVTNTSFIEKFNDSNSALDYIVTTGLFNQVSMTKFIGIEYNKE